MMMKLYKKMWAGVINVAIKNNGNWKPIIFAIPVFQGFNLLTILILLKFLTGYGYSIPSIPIFKIEKLNSLITGFIFYILPFILFNYYIVIYKDKYKDLIKEFPNANGKLVAYYMLASFLAFFTPIILGIIME